MTNVEENHRQYQRRLARARRIAIAISVIGVLIAGVALWRLS